MHNLLESCVETKIYSKQPNCEKGAALFKMASVKKVVRSKGAAKKCL